MVVPSRMVFLKENHSLKTIRDKVRIKKLARSSSNTSENFSASYPASDYDSHGSHESGSEAENDMTIEYIDETAVGYSRPENELSDMDTVENTMFKKVKTPTRRFYVTIGRDQQIWTMTANTKSRNKPIVLVHGFCGGIGFWINNIDRLAQDHPVYAFDLLGFGRSSRSYFSEDAAEAEHQFVDAIEKWRRQMNLKDIILMGHSFGGFLSMSYALKYPRNVHKLVMIDSWGLGDSRANEKDQIKVLLARAAYRAVSRAPTNVKASNVFRASGKLGIEVFKFFRPTYKRHFDQVLDDPRVIYRYIYHANKPNPTGEDAFKVISDAFYFAKNPMINRFDKLSDKIPVWFVHGSASFIDYTVAIEMTSMRSNRAPTHMKLIADGDHHFYAGKAAEFHAYIAEVIR